MDKTVTQPGAERPARNSRAEMFNHIHEKRIDKLNSELSDTDKVDFVPDVDPEDEDADPDAAAAGAGDDAAAGGDAGDGAAKADGDDAAAGKDQQEETIYTFLGEDKLDKTKIKIKVDGQEQDVIVADILRDTQKLKAADKRLEEASLTKKKAEETAAETIRKANEDADTIRAKANRTKAKSGTQAGDDDDTDVDGKEKKGSPSTSDAIKSAVSHIYEGDQDKAAEELGNVINDEVKRRVGEVKQTDTTVDQKKALKNEVKTEIAWDSALEHFSADHKDIVADPYLLGMWQGQLDEAAKTSSTPQEAIKKATDHVTAWLDKKVSEKSGGKKVIVEDEALQKRQQQKQEANKHVASSSTSQRAPRGQQQDEPQKPSSVIAEMKAKRGQK